MLRTVFRVFLSSTFGDFQAEREALRAKVWPKLEQYCQSREASFQLVDLRWGISPQAALTHDTIGVCLDEVRRCQQLSPRPNFVMLIGDRYGWRPAPVTIPADEFIVVLGCYAGTPSATALLKRWYVLDSNAVPPVYVLAPREDQYADGEIWAAVEAELLGLLRQAATDLGISPERRELYFLSATHQEIVHGLLRSPDAQEHVFAFERRINGLPTTATDGLPRRFSDYTPEGIPEPEAAKLRQELLNEIEQVLPPEQVYRYSAQWQGAEDPISTNHLDQLCDEVEASLRQVIASQLPEQNSSQQAEPTISGALSEELAGQEQFCRERGTNFLGRNKELTAITSYAKKAVTSQRPVEPLVIHGPGGSGKSALLAKGIERLQHEFPAALLIYRFIGTTPRSWDVNSCLFDLLAQLSRSLGKDEPEIENPTPRKLGEKLQELLEQAAEQQPVLLVLDALDQFGGNMRLADFLPQELPRQVGLILSVLDGPQQQALANLYPTAKEIAVPVLNSTECKQLLASLIAPRILTPAQQQSLLHPAQVDGRPLYLTLLAPIARKLKSGDPVPPLPTTVEELVRFVLAEISSRHGEKLTRHALAYLKTARFGLSETELQEILWRDSEVREEFDRTKNPDQPEVNNLPPILWSRLYAELDPYLNEQWMDNCLLYRFFHRVVADEVLSFATDSLPLPSVGEGRGEGIFHSRLADYFHDQPLYLDQIVNGRKVMELSWHLVQSQRIDEAKAIVTDFDFAMAKCRLNRSEDWVEDFARINKASTTPDQSRDWRIWESFVKSHRHTLRRGNNGWPAHKILLQLATEHADDSPATICAEKFLAEGKCDWPWLRRERRVEHAGVDPCIAVFEGHTGSINGVILLSCGRILSWSSDGTLRLWGSDGVPLSIMEGHTETIWGVLNLTDGRFLSWSYDNTLRLWSNDGTPLKVLEGHTDAVQDVHILDDGRFMSWSYDHTIRLWSNDGTPLKVLEEGHAGKIKRVETLSNANFLSLSEDHTPRLWSNDGTLLKVLEGHTGAVRDFHILDDGRFLSWSDDHTMRLWANDGTLLKVLEGHAGAVQNAHILDDGRFLSWSDDHTMRLWANDGALLKVLEGHTSNIDDVQILSDGKFLSWSYTTFYIWSNDGKSLAIIYGCTEDRVSGVFPIGDGRFLIYEGSTLHLWDNDGKRLALMNIIGSVAGIRPLADGRSLLLSSKGTLYFLDKDLVPLSVLVGHEARIKGVHILPGKKILSWSWDGTLRLWENETLPIEVLEGHTSKVTNIHLMSNGRFLTWSDFDDHKLRLWEKDGTPLAVMEGHPERVSGIHNLSKNRFITWSSDNALRIWRDDGELLEVMERHSDEVQGVHILPDGRILSWSQDQTICLWSNDGRLLNVINRQNEGGVELLREHRFVSWSKSDRDLRLWDDDGTQVALMKGHSENITGIHLLADARILSWSRRENNLYIWGETGTPLHVLQGHKRPVKKVEILPNGNILSWGQDTSLYLWGNDGTLLSILMGHQGSIECVKTFSDGTIISWSKFDESLRVWNQEGISIAVVEKYPGNLEKDEVKKLPDGRFIFIFRTGDDKLILWANDWIQQGTISRRNIFKSESIVWQTFLKKECQAFEFGLDSLDKGTVLGGMENPLHWYSQSSCMAHHLFEEGRSIVTQINGQVCLLHTYSGNRQIPLLELKKKNEN